MVDNRSGDYSPAAVNLGDVTIPSGTKLRAAMALAVLADVAQIALFPLFMEGGASPVDDVLDLAMAGVLSYLLGWHWEFAPSFVGELVPGLNFVPLWTLAVANVWRKTKRLEGEPEREGLVIEGEPVQKK